MALKSTNAPLWGAAIMLGGGAAFICSHFGEGVLFGAIGAATFTRGIVANNAYARGRPYREQARFRRNNIIS